ncbi:MAG: precorrin-3B synthase [Shinella sp.]|nr:precorrin-3B synthase [Shinella sp.]
MAATLFCEAGPDAMQTASLRRGACPSLSRPMKTGDGLLVRLRPLEAGLAPSAFRTIARLSAGYGNGLMDVTARGNLQIRGLREETVPLLSAALEDAGLFFQSGIAIEVPPLAGLDPAEFADPNGLADDIRKHLRQRGDLALAPKLSIVVDGGGALGLGHLNADIRLDAVAGAGGARWRLSLGGDRRSARFASYLSHNVAVEAVIALLEKLAAQGPTARGRDLDLGGVRALLGGESVAAERDDASPVPRPSPIGLHAIGSEVVLGIGLAYGQATAGGFEALMAGIEALGAREIRLSAGRAFLVRGLEGKALAETQQLARAEGFWTDAATPGSFVSVCAGSAGCISGHFDTRLAADALVAEAPELLDGTTAVHLSACPKGCAHPGGADLVVVGSDEGARLVMDGRAGDPPQAVVPLAALPRSLASLGASARRARRSGENAGSFLRRARETLVTAFRQGSE